MWSIVWRIPGLKQVRRSGWLNHKLRLGFGAYWGHSLVGKMRYGFFDPLDSQLRTTKTWP